MRSGGSGRVTEYEILRGGRVLAEAENLAAGVSARFSLTLQPGRYELLCPGGTRGEPGALVVTGTRSRAALAPPLARGVRGYRRYLERQAGELMARTARFAAALRAGDAARARALFAVTRAPYERIEPVAESFGDLDPRIDARVNDVEPGRPWTGFHAIERRLWVKRTARGTTALARKLERDVARLARLVRTVRLEPAQIANGATALLGEVARSKITGEEDRYSHTDLWDFAANVEGARAAYDAIAPALRERDPALHREVQRRFARSAPRSPPTAAATASPSTPRCRATKCAGLRGPSTRSPSRCRARRPAAWGGERDAAAVTVRAVGLGGRRRRRCRGGGRPRPRPGRATRRREPCCGRDPVPRPPPGRDRHPGAGPAGLRRLRPRARPATRRPGGPAASVERRRGAHDRRPARRAAQRHPARAARRHRRGVRPHAGPPDRHRRPRAVRVRRPFRPGRPAARRVAVHAAPARRRARSSRAPTATCACRHSPTTPRSPSTPCATLARIARGAALIRWTQLGFGRTSSTSRAQATPRNLMGFRDGTNNLKAEDAATMHKHVWVAGDSAGEPAWLVDGTYLVARRIRMHIEAWDRSPLEEQEQTFGRHKVSGAPFGATREFDPVHLARLPADSHVRLATPRSNGGASMLRRSYSFTDGLDPKLGQLDAWLFFLAYVRDPRAFIAVQRRLGANDALNEYIKHVASGLWVIPPGARHGGGVGRTLFV